MEAVKHKRWLKIFVAVAFLVLLQVVWWTSVFMRDVSLISHLRSENLRLQSQSGSSVLAYSREQIEKEAFHRRLMFLSESVSFVLLTCFGLYLLFHALKVEARSREIQKNFIEIVSHESKTPITALKLRLESMSEKGSSNANLSHELTRALEEVRRLSSIFDRAMNLNRLDRHALVFERVSMSEMVREVIRRLEPFFRARKVALSLDVDSEAVVRGDFQGLQNCLQSLLENAVIYNDKEEKSVSISVKNTRPRVLVGIADNGPGIEGNDRAHIFERFYRGQSGKQIPGTGLGLYIAKTVIEAHQGAIRLVQTGKSGAAFEIELPAVT